MLDLVGNSSGVGVLFLGTCAESFISYSPESAFFLSEKTKLAHPASHPSFVHGMDIVFFNEYFWVVNKHKEGQNEKSIL